MRYSNWTAEQFLDSNSLNLLTTNVSGNSNAMGRATIKPGLLSPEAATFAASGLAINSTLTPPFGVCFSNGTIAHAHGSVTGLDTTAYTTSFSGLVPGSGPAVTAYLLASYAQIFENPFTNVGPPVGHPDFNPNFVPSTAYETQLDTLLLNASLTPADNLLTFELGRATLAVGATGVVLSTVFQNRVSAPNTTQVVQVSGNTVLSVQSHGGHMVQAIAPCTISLPAASGTNGVLFGFMSAVTGAVTIQTQGSDLIFGYGGATSSGVPSIALAPFSSVSFLCADSLYEVVGGSSQGIGAIVPALGQCLLSVSSATTLTLSPYQGQYLTIKGQPQAIPGTGVSITPATTGSTFYYIYAFMSGGSIAMELSTTTHATDTVTAGNIGVEIKSGDPTRTLVGAVTTDSSGHFNNTSTLRNVANWFNRTNNDFSAITVGDISTPTPTEVNATGRIEITTWATEAVTAMISDSVISNQNLGVSQIWFGLDGSVTAQGSTSTSPIATSSEAAVAGFSTKLSEGHHTLSIFGNAGTGTSTFHVSMHGVVRN